MTLLLLWSAATDCSRRQLGRGVPAVLTRLICLMGGLQGGNIGRWYCLHGAGYTAVRTIQLLFYRERDLVRGIRVCGLYMYAGYMRENTIITTILWHRGMNRDQLMTDYEQLSHYNLISEPQLVTYCKHCTHITVKFLWSCDIQ